MSDGRDVRRRLLLAGPEKRRALLSQLSAGEVLRFAGDWPSWLHDGQEPPKGDDWRVWVMLAGRGFGKTRAGAEWVSGLARAPSTSLGTGGRVQIALVAANPDEARRVMVEGRSGLLAVATPWERERMLWEPSRRRLRFASGAEAFIYSGAHADGLRGPEHHFAWCDELAKWEQAQGAWDNLMLGLRLGARPRALVTTTPRPLALLKEIIGGEGTEETGGATSGNPHLAAGFADAMERKHKGTRFGRQELQGELIEDFEGALWPRDLIDASRCVPLARELTSRVVIGVDPPSGTTGDACGIVAVGLDRADVAYVLGDHSVAGLSPDGWARKVAAAAEMHEAVKLVAEANNGGKMVEAVLRGAGVQLPVRLVHAAEGKVARAAPVAALFESGRAKLAGRFGPLEDELAGLCWDGAYRGPGRSPDRADAMVWAMTDLMLGPRREPRIHIL